MSSPTRLPVFASVPVWYPLHLLETAKQSVGTGFWGRAGIRLHGTRPVAHGMDLAVRRFAVFFLDRCGAKIVPYCWLDPRRTKFLYNRNLIFVQQG